MSDDARRRLEDLLDREIEAARSLAAVLDAERAALTGSSTAAVEERAAEKLRLLRGIETMEDERRSLANAAGQNLPGARLAREAGLAATVAQRWRTLMELMAGCRSSNQVNGYIIHTRQNQLQQLLGIVRGAAPLTYTAQGKTFARAQRPLAKA
jgi:flagellar biosynthesis/type III secretory pathway chaperone